MNTIFAIRPYKWNGLWVFDDAERGLNREPFVAGADTMIDIAVTTLDIKNPDMGFVALFSEERFPEAQITLDWVRSDSFSGDWYRWTGQDMEGWLCSSLLKFFPKPPKHIYIALRNKE